MSALADLEIGVRESGTIVAFESLPTLLIEEAPLTMVFQNLIGNANKYRREGEAPRVQVSSSRTATEWMFSVRDKGIGIGAEYLDAVFAPFKRLHASEYSGTGIGLAISRKIVESDGGRIRVESAYGQGSVFHFTIPVQGEETARIEPCPRRVLCHASLDGFVLCTFGKPA